MKQLTYPQIYVPKNLKICSNYKGQCQLPNLNPLKHKDLNFKIQRPRKTHYDRQAIWLIMFTKKFCVYSALISVNKDAK